ncbi:MAG: Hsp20/alpha crystallin family protein [Lachnospiraceae bacterium]|nr:Hsp20/alpha crystallin family protein [Lachnospiraceae bacterium]
MLLPSIFEENLLNDWMNFPRMDFPDVDKKLYGKNASHIMKTDVHENEDGYELDIDLPGFKKDDIKLSLENGYLFISASKAHENDETNDKGKVIRKERYSGSMQRSFYVGDSIEEEDVKAKFEDGVLKLEVPKKDNSKVPEKKYISIEG